MMNLTVLCENTAIPSSGIIGEHGFSVFIEKAEKTYLFDTGQKSSVIHNAGCLKKDLKNIDRVFLSHGHYDHTGGLLSVLSLTLKADIYAHQDIFSERVAIIEKATEKLEKKCWHT